MTAPATKRTPEPRRMPNPCTCASCWFRVCRGCKREVWQPLGWTARDGAYGQPHKCRGRR